VTDKGFCGGIRIFWLYNNKCDYDPTQKPLTDKEWFLKYFFVWENLFDILEALFSLYDYTTLEKL
jgi:hypothetical protein